MLRIIALTLCLAALACTGCTSRSSSEKHCVSTAEAAAPSVEYHEHWHNDRLYVIGCSDELAKFKKAGHLPYTKTLIGGGPNGKTVVIENRTKINGDKAAAAAYNKALFAAYNEQYPFYREMKHDGRIYVLGNSATFKSFLTAPHLAYTKTYIRKGDNNETLIFEHEKKGNDLLKRLVRRYNEKHGSTLNY